MEVRAEVSRQKVTEVEEARWMAERMVMELRGSLGLLEIMRDATRSKLHEAQQLITGASSSLPSFPHLWGRVFCSRSP